MALASVTVYFGVALATRAGRADLRAGPPPRWRGVPGRGDVERHNGTPFTDTGFEHVPALAHLQTWLAELVSAAA